MHCFTGASVETILRNLRARFFPDLSEDDCVERLVELIDEAVCNWRTVQYDTYVKAIVMFGLSALCVQYV
jgi:hypothetical protein